jgi:peroxiredoxin
VPLRESTSGRRLRPGDTAPSFTLPDAAGEPVRVEPGAHWATVIVFTSNGCPYALAWHDRIQDLARDYAGRDVRVVQVVSNADELQPADSVDGMRARKAAGEVAGPYLKDADQAVARAYGATATPEVFVLDRAGVVRYHGAPDGDHDDPAQAAGWARAALDSVLAARVVARPATAPAGCSIKWRVDLLWWDGCPSHEQAAELVADTLAAMGRTDVAVRRVRVESAEDAQRYGLPGSPTFHVGRADLFPTDAAPALTCRVYRRQDGRAAPLPAPEELRERLAGALARPWDLPGWTDFRRSAAARRDADAAEGASS